MFETRLECVGDKAAIRSSAGIRLCKRYPLAMYFFLAFAFTWLILCPGVAAALGRLNFEFEGPVLTIVSGIGPLSAAILMTGAIEGKSGIQRFLTVRLPGR